ncbi:MAG: right-handed parallel beta-helix repeat-containing protein [Micrococcales bacterium]|nr:right-handed parallel beta-helix repeat-containing protein [Micrococcales bacterium]
MGNRRLAVLLVTIAGLPLMLALPVGLARADDGPHINTNPDPVNSIYVSTDGEDSTATGSIDAPFGSINTALDAAQSGDTIVLRGGTYKEGTNVRVRLPNITIKSRENEWAVIDLTSFDPGNDEDSGVYFDVDASGGRLQGVEVMGGFYAVAMESKWDWGDPADRGGASDIVIEDCLLHDSRYDVVKIKPNCDNVVIRNNEIYNSGQAFAGNPKNGEDNAEGIDNVNGHWMTVQGNYIHDICSNAIYGKGGATGMLVENNVIETAYGAGVMVGFDTSPEYFDTTVNPDYFENIEGVVRNNLIVGTGWEGIGLYGSKDAEVYNNTLVDVANSGNYHSAIYFGLTYQDWEEEAGRPANLNPSIHHNIVSLPSSNVLPMIEIRYSDELGGLTALAGNPVMNDNCYHVADQSAVFSDHRPGSVLENGDLAAWQNHIGGDTGSLEADPVLGSDYLPTNPMCSASGYSPSAVLPAGDRNDSSQRPQAPDSDQTVPLSNDGIVDPQASLEVVEEAATSNDATLWLVALGALAGLGLGLLAVLVHRQIKQRAANK